MGKDSEGGLQREKAREGGWLLGAAPPRATPTGLCSELPSSRRRACARGVVHAARLEHVAAELAKAF